jgi:hypothetical protein
MNKKLQVGQEVKIGEYFCGAFECYAEGVIVGFDNGQVLYCVTSSDKDEVGAVVSEAIEFVYPLDFQFEE